MSVSIRNPKTGLACGSSVKNLERKPVRCWPMHQSLTPAVTWINLLWKESDADFLFPFWHHSDLIPCFNDIVHGRVWHCSYHFVQTLFWKKSINSGCFENCETIGIGNITGLGRVLGWRGVTCPITQFSWCKYFALLYSTLSDQTENTLSNRNGGIGLCRLIR